MFPEYIEMLKNVKEDKPVKTRVHELLGVEPGEVFFDSVAEMKDCSRSKTEYMISEHGTPLRQYNKEGWREMGGATLAAFIERPESVVRRHPLTDEQREVLVALRRLGFRFVALDKDGEICAYDETPVIRGASWINYAGHFSTRGFDCLRPLLPDWTVPLDIEKTLRDAGVEV